LNVFYGLSRRVFQGDLVLHRNEVWSDLSIARIGTEDAVVETDVLGTRDGRELEKEVHEFAVIAAQHFVARHVVGFQNARLAPAVSTGPSCRMLFSEPFRRNFEHHTATSLVPGLELCFASLTVQRIDALQANAVAVVESSIGVDVVGKMGNEEGPMLFAARQIDIFDVCKTRKRRSNRLAKSTMHDKRQPGKQTYHHTAGPPVNPKRYYHP